MPGQHPAGRRRVSSAAVVLAGVLAVATTEATEQPLLEFGLGAGAIAFQDYRGSSTTHGYPLPVPYFVYNGKFLKADREGLLLPTRAPTAHSACPAPDPARNS